MTIYQTFFAFSNDCYILNYNGELKNVNKIDTGYILPTYSVTIITYSINMNTGDSTFRVISDSVELKEFDDLCGIY